MHPFYLPPFPLLGGIQIGFQFPPAELVSFVIPLPSARTIQSCCSDPRVTVTTRYRPSGDHAGSLDLPGAAGPSHERLFPVLHGHDSHARRLLGGAQYVGDSFARGGPGRLVLDDAGRGPHLRQAARLAAGGGHQPYTVGALAITHEDDHLAVG